MAIDSRLAMMYLISYLYDFMISLLKIAGVLAAAYLAQVLFAFLMGWV
jgi:hypothetical protein